jgi:hypothetical protein
MFLAALSLDRQRVLGEVDVDVILFESGEIGSNDVPIAFLERLDARRPSALPSLPRTTRTVGDVDGDPDRVRRAYRRFSRSSRADFGDEAVGELAFAGDEVAVDVRHSAAVSVSANAASARAPSRMWNSFIPGENPDPRAL